MGEGGGWWRFALNLLEVRLRGFGRAEDEVTLHLIELGVVWVSHPTALAAVDTGDGAHFYSAPIRDIGGGSHEGIAPPPRPLTLGGVSYSGVGVLAGGRRIGRGGFVPLVVRVRLEPLPLLCGGGGA